MSIPAHHVVRVQLAGTELTIETGRIARLFPEQGYGFIEVGGYFVSFMSGNSTRMVVGFAEGDFTMPVSSRALLEEWGDWEIHVVPPEKYEHNKYTPSQQVVWFRSKRPLPDDERFHVCTLAYMSDMTLLHSSLVPHPGHKVQMASLDHAMWFLRPFRADDWLMYDQVSPSAHAGRALTHGRIFDRAGNLVAMVTQEGLTRTLRPGSQSIPVKTPGSD